ncbi:MAG TPA: hypothetical protein VGG06_34900 [Thermoanaerobaculia bacterium]
MPVPADRDHEAGTPDRTCLRELDLDVWLRRRLEKIKDVLVRKPEYAYKALSALRRAMIVSVPGLL